MADNGFFILMFMTDTLIDENVQNINHLNNILYMYFINIYLVVLILVKYTNSLPIRLFDLGILCE